MPHPSEKTSALKVCIIGDSGTGKSDLLEMFVNQDIVYFPFPTVCAENLKKEVKISDTQSVTLQLWDNPGKERFKSMRTPHYQGSHAVMLVYDITNRDSFNHILAWKKEFQESTVTHNSTALPMMLVGNKNDLEDGRKVPTDEAQKFAAENGMLFSEVSAKKLELVEPAFIALTLETVKQLTEEERETYLTSPETETEKQTCPTSSQMAETYFMAGGNPLKALSFFGATPERNYQWCQHRRDKKPEGAPPSASSAVLDAYPQLNKNR